ncbi:MAG: hypothetical protein IJT19_08560 [Bacteroidaceae bacterium]|nr:hypothetical protein [Bacteroidaceae bacterium]
MRPCSILLSLVLLCAASLVGAQNVRGTAKLIARSGETAILLVQCYGHNERAVLDNAKKLPLQKLLYEGVEGLSDEPIVSKDIDPKQHLWLMKFFTEEPGRDTYDEYVEGLEVLGDIRTSSTGGYEGSAHVFLKYDRLLRKAKNEGVVKPATSGNSGGGWL